MPSKYDVGLENAHGNPISPSHPMSIDHGKLLALSPEAIEAGWRATFSTDNPFCPCDLKTFAKAARWAERALAQPAEAVEGADGDSEHAEEVAKILANRGFHAASATVRRLVKKHDAAQGAVADVALTARRLLADQIPAQVTKDLLINDNVADGIVGTRVALAAIEAALRTHPQAAPAQGDDETAWREGWAMAYSGAQYLYGDDGELQDNRWPMIDWRRDSAMEIRQKIDERGMRALAAAPSQEGES